MSERFIVAAQVSTASLPPGEATAEWVLRAVDRVAEITPLDILIVGGREAPELYRALTASGARYAGQVFLWYNLLSDYPGMAALPEGVIGHRGRPADGWGEADGETFRFACPNNPVARRKTLRTLERLLDRYAFDGVFLDKIRFPSPANGTEALLSCFCPACREAAAAAGLDLEAVRATLESPRKADRASPEVALPPGAPWLDALLSGHPTLQRFLRFRADSITRIVAEAGAVVAEAGRSVALDLFSPALAPLVGQDYPALGRLAEWGKPMTYRITCAPAGLRLEAPALIRALAARLGIRQQDAMAWVREQAPSLARTDLAAMDRSGLPADFVTEELRRSVPLLAPAHTYMGLETVSFPGICEATPGSVLETIAAGRQAGVAGLVMSWDLLDTPLENVHAVAQALE